MAFVRQIVLTLIALLLAGVVWLHLSEVPGRYLLSDAVDLPAPVSGWVSALSPADDAPKVGATPQGERRLGAIPLVVTDPAIPAVTRDQLRAIGTAEAIRTVAVRPDASGIIREIGFRSGDEVEAGATLATLQNDAERVAVERARITLAAGEDQLRRYQSLSASSSITSVQVDEVRRARDAAALDLQAAEIALDKRNITAPISGRVGILDLDVGALIDGTTLIATVDDRSKLKIVFNVPEAFTSELQLGQSVSAQPTTRSGEAYEGQISALDSRLDQASRTLRAEAVIDNEADLLRPGMSFGIEIGFGGSSFLSVDPLAIQWERAGPFVWVAQNDISRKAPISIIERNVDRVLVASQTLRENDAVITEGVQQLREGAPVRVQQPVTAPPAPATPDAGAPSASGEPTPLRRADAAGATRAPGAPATGSAP
ncbi:efflux RND transporter periplasmic adaptor subunit [Aureimonas sp. AU12]|uniref:efflux RND transporter periplasmic adaptor subunit n=1 Tax=Aureimonas sp. AU12 TaxID=1638161 RepID=UPI0007835685|nr:efflux RND transporter periplasmic adaptor subunit [Aureimonas sp. AU12]